MKHDKHGGHDERLHSGRICTVCPSSMRTNMTYDAAARPAAEETVGFVYDSAYVRVQLDGPVGFVYDGVRALQTYDPPTLPGVKMTYDAGPVADEPLIVERGEKQKEGGPEAAEQ
jgi:hypothetical protein